MYKVPSDKRDRLLKSEFLIKQFKVERLEAFWLEPVCWTDA
jgi:hypothetical protein